MNTITLLVTGYRHWPHAHVVREQLERFLAYAESQQAIPCVIVGDATGADQMVRDWCEAQLVDVMVFAADWETHGKSAGPKRNALMIDERPDFAVAFLHPNSKGTLDCIRQCEAARIPTRVVHSDSVVTKVADCAECQRANYPVPHYGSPRCQSRGAGHINGNRAHCTCDKCF